MSRYTSLVLSSSQTSVNIVAVVVTYQPTLDQLQRQLDSLVPQVDAVVVVDNHSNVDLSVWMKLSAKPARAVIQLESNQGVARAQNIGIAWARKQEATHILLMDQDSIPAPDMVRELIRAAQSSADVAAVGPRYLDSRHDSRTPFVRIRGLRFHRLPWDASHPILPVDCLIASGSLIPIAALDRVGLMREDLFIDYVDTEWCLRAHRQGLQAYGVCSAAMNHSLGETPHLFLGRSVPVHSPLRHYYQIRNAILLYRESWVPLNWKLAISWHLLLKFGFYSLMTAPRLQHLRMMTRGLWHGIRGRAGPLRP